MLSSQGSILSLGMFLKQQRFSSSSWCTMFWEMSKSSVKLTSEKSVWNFHIWATQILQIAVFNSVVASHCMIKILLLQNCLVIFSSYLCNNRDILHTKHCSCFESHVTWFNWNERGNLKLSWNIVLFQLYKILQGHKICPKNLHRFRLKSATAYVFPNMQFLYSARRGKQHQYFHMKFRNMRTWACSKKTTSWKLILTMQGNEGNCLFYVHRKTPISIGDFGTTAK
jgi:hypothetical protein